MYLKAYHFTRVMIYIHKLDQLTPGIADIESVSLIREIKSETRFPISEEGMKRKFTEFFVKELDIAAMQEALQNAQPAIDEIAALIEKKDPDFEEVNLLRAYKLVNEVPDSLMENINYAKEIFEWQNEFLIEITNVFNGLANIKSSQELLNFNERLNKIFMKILRNDEFTFKFQDVIHEGHVEHMNDLKTILPQGFLFKILIEEELNKVDFNVIQKRIARAKLDAADRIWNGVLEIKKGVDKAYQINMKMIELSVMLYSYVKFFKHR